MGLWRCCNENCSTDPAGRLIFDFEADEPVCPKCGCDHRKPLEANVIVKLEAIHFDPPSHVKGRGLGYPACRPEKSVLGSHASGVHDAVTCRGCRESEVFKSSYAASRPWDATDHEVEIDFQKMIVAPKKG